MNVNNVIVTNRRLSRCCARIIFQRDWWELKKHHSYPKLTIWVFVYNGFLYAVKAFKLVILKVTFEINACYLSFYVA